MITLSKTRLAKRSLLFLAFFVSILVGIFAAAKTIKLFQVSAAEGQAAVSSSGSPISYDENATYRYSVTVNGGTYNALCAEPSKDPPSGDTYNYSTLNNDKIKLLVYLATNSSTAANNLVDSLYGDLASTSDKRFAYIHATIGAINGDYKGLTTNRSKIETIANGTGTGSLASAISNNTDAWLIAKNYTLYATSPTDDIHQSVVWIEGDFQYGNIKVQKCDKETQSCDAAQGSASFSGIKFEVYNNSGSRIYNPQNGNFYNNGALITSGTTNASGTVTFANLPLNVQYQVKEATTNNSYLLTASAQTTTITTSGGTNTLKFYDDIVRGDLKFTKISDVDGEPMANVVFKIKSTNSSEEHLVITDEDGIVDTSASHASHEFHTNGYDNMEEDELEYLGYGTWFGLSSMADDTKGALPYGSYTITELQCDANKFCYDIGAESQTITINTNNQVIDLGEWSNDCAEFSIKTTATDNSDGDKILAVNQDVEIKDTVEYCLKKGMEFTLEGVLMDKATKQPVLVDGEKVTQSITITPDTTCGTTEMVYSLNTKDLSGVDLVIFEDLYYGDELILSHSDFDDEGQSISVAPDIPDTGAVTEPVNGSILSDGKTMIITITGISFGLYAAVRLFSRKRFLSKR